MAQNPEDLQIRNILITGATVAGVGLIVAVITIAVMVAYNFNFLQWME